MKRIIYTVAALSLTVSACQIEKTEIDDAITGTELRLEAGIASTRTSLTYDGESYKVAWDADDALGIVAEYEGNAYESYEFTNDSGNTFVCGNVTEPDNIRTLYAVYPYVENQNIDDAGYFSVPVMVGTDALQSGTDMTGHIDAPLYGIGDAEGVDMVHASTLFDVVLTNSIGQDMEVTDIVLNNDADAAMTGGFYINPLSGALKADSEALPSARLKVEGGILPSGRDAHFYLTSAPFGLEAGQSVTVSVTTAGGARYEAVKTVEKATEFMAGKVNHIKVDMTADDIKPQRIFVDFGLWKDGRVSESPWNNLTSFENHSLKDEAGNASGVSIDLTDWTGANKFEEYYTSGFKTVDDILFNGITIPETAFMDWLLSDKKDKASFVISGLDPEQLYEFTTVSIRWNSASNVREMSIDIQGNGETQNSGLIHQGLKCGTNEYEMADDWASIGWDQYCKIFTLKPSADGTVIVTLNATSVVTTSTNCQAHLNALVITPVTE